MSVLSRIPSAFRSPGIGTVTSQSLLTGICRKPDTVLGLSGAGNMAAAVVSAVCNHLSFRPKCNCDGGRSCPLGPSDEGAAHFCRGQRSRGGGVFSGLEGSACPSTESFGKEMLGALCASYSSLPPSCRQRRSLAAQPVGSTWAMSCVQLALLLLSRHHNKDSGADPNP